MFRKLPHTGGSIIALLTVSCAGNPERSFETSIDPGGCLVEHVAVAADRGQFHFDGLSPDGKRIAVGWDRDGEENGLYVLDLMTGGQTVIPNLNNGAVFSPDGKKLLNIVPTENGTTDIVEYDLETGELESIAPHDAWEWLASYSSDGDVILFNSYRTGGSDIYTYRKADGALKQWTDYNGYDAHGQFSPDDSKILFNRHEGGDDYNVYVIETETGEISQLTDETTEEGYASWSPDGGTIVFASDRLQASGEPDLFLMTSDGDDIRRLTDHEAKDEYPFFSPDGQYIYFNSYRSTPKGIYRITLDSELNCVKAKTQ